MARQQVGALQRGAMGRLLLVLACLVQAMIVAQAFMVRPSGPIVSHGGGISPRPRQPPRRQQLRMIGDLISFFGSGEPQGIPRSIKDGVNALRYATQRAVRLGLRLE